MLRPIPIIIALGFALAFFLPGPVVGQGGIGPGLVRRLPGDRLRVGIALLGLGLAVKLGLDTFGQAGGPG